MTNGQELRSTAAPPAWVPHYPEPVPNPVLLSDLTTFRLGGPAPDLVTAVSGAEIADAVGSADRAGWSPTVGSTCRSSGSACGASGSSAGPAVPRWSPSARANTGTTSSRS